MTLGELDLSRACAAAAAAPIQRSVGSDAVEKGREARFAPEAVTVPVKAEEGFLRRILGLFAAPEHPVEQSEDVALVGANEALEGGRVAGLPALDQLGVRVLRGSEFFGLSNPGGQSPDRAGVGDL